MPGSFLAVELFSTVFAQCCKALGTDIIVEVGGFDGTDSAIMAHNAPEAKLISFEANPENFFEFSLSDRMRKEHVSVQHIAISDVDGLAELIVPEPPLDADDRLVKTMRGMGSMLDREDYSYKRTYSVTKRRLDTFFSAARSSRFGIWVDAEGHTREVIKGAHGLMSRVPLVKLELESVPYWTGQAVDIEVIALMKECGFESLVTSDPAPLQYDALFIKSEFAGNDAVQAIVDHNLGF